MKRVISLPACALPYSHSTHRARVVHTESCVLHAVGPGRPADGLADNRTSYETEGAGDDQADDTYEVPIESGLDGAYRTPSDEGGNTTYEVPVEGDEAVAGKGEVTDYEGHGRADGAGEDAYEDADDTYEVPVEDVRLMKLWEITFPRTGGRTYDRVIGAWC